MPTTTETGTRPYYSGRGSYTYRVVAENDHGRRIERRQDTEDKSVCWVITHAGDPTVRVTEVLSTRADALDSFARYDQDEASA